MNLHVSPQEAAKAILQRRELRRSPAAWCRFCGYEPARHHLFLIDRLERIAHGEIERLAIFMPPGSAKSTYASVLFGPWFLARKPQGQILAPSPAQELARD